MHPSSAAALGDIGFLPTLDALLQEGSVSGAAARVGLSPPAVSHALARLRERLGDPLLVRAGRRMVLTPRALALKPRVRAAVEQLGSLFAAEAPFAPATVARTFRVRIADHALTVMGPALDRLVAHEAPGVVLRFLPNAADDAEALRAGDVDLAIGNQGALPPELRRQRLYADKFICVVREGHPIVGERLGLETFLGLGHVLIAPRGQAEGFVDEALGRKGMRRRIVRVVPYFMAGLLMVAGSDHVLTVAERLARAFAAPLRLRPLAPPLALERYTLSQLWHPRLEADPAHLWLRAVVLRAAREVAAG